MARSRKAGSVCGAQQFAANTDLVAYGKKGPRIERLFTNPDFIMQMRAIHTAGAAHPSDNGANRDIGALAYGDFRQMRIGGDDAVGMPHLDDLAE